MKTMLSEPGVAKLGPSVHSFSLPAVQTCPGRSRLCESLCYARRNRFAFPAVKEAMRRRAAESDGEHFATRMIAEVAMNGVEWVRVHVSGDFYSPGYAREWLRVMKACPGTHFWFYTRSWRGGPEAVAMRHTFRAMARLGNVQPWYSFDRETGPPPTDRGIFRAYMATGPDDAPPRKKADLAFLAYRPKSVTKAMGTARVCPREDLVERNTRPTCGRCRLCSDRAPALRRA